MAKKSKKAEWEVSHKCINCGKLVDMLICNYCGKFSIKTKK